VAAAPPGRAWAGVPSGTGTRRRVTGLVPSQCRNDIMIISLVMISARRPGGKRLPPGRPGPRRPLSPGILADGPAGLSRLGHSGRAVGDRLSLCSSEPSSGRLDPGFWYRAADGGAGSRSPGYRRHPALSWLHRNVVRSRRFGERPCLVTLVSARGAMKFYYFLYDLADSQAEPAHPAPEGRDAR
jgi:hypothetical protein